MVQEEQWICIFQSQHLRSPRHLQRRTLRRRGDRKIPIDTKGQRQVGARLKSGPKLLVARFPEDLGQGRGSEALPVFRQVDTACEVARQAVRHRHRSDEKHVEFCKRTVRDAEAAEPGGVAGVPIAPESELAVEYGCEGDVLPV